jgi:transposase
MSLRPEPLPAMPAATVAAVRAAFPKGHLSVDLRAEFGTLSTDQLFPDLYPPEGRPVEVAPWRLALVLVMQYIAGLTDRQAADAVRRCLDGQDALRLDLHAPGFACTLLPDLRERLRAHDAPQRVLDTCLTACQARGWLKARGPQRTDSTPVLAALRPLNRLAWALATLRAALHQLSEADPQWVRQGGPLEWYQHYAPRAESCRLPTEASQRAALAVPLGAAGDARLDTL